MVLALGLAVAVAFLWGVIPGLPHGTPNPSAGIETPITGAGTFEVGNPSQGRCSSVDSYAGQGCRAGDYAFTMTIESSVVELDNVLFKVTDSAGTVVTAATLGGFTILNATDAVQAQSSARTTLSMDSSWATYAPGISGSTPLTNLDSILVDIGSGNPAGSALEFVASRIDGYTGNTSVLTLPTPLPSFSGALTFGRTATSVCSDATLPPGCITAGDYAFTLPVTSSSVSLGNFLLEVAYSSGTIYSVTRDGGFSIVNGSSETLLGAFDLSSAGRLDVPAASSWSYSNGAAGSTHLTSQDVVVVDAGSSNPACTGIDLIAVGSLDYTGTSAPVALVGTCTPIGSAFAAGNPNSGRCPTNDTYAADGCTAGDYTYTLTIESSAVTFANVLFEVRTPTGSVLNLTSPGGFSVTSITGVVSAQTLALSSLSMSATWAVYHASVAGSTPLTPLYVILIDVGTTGPTGNGDFFTVAGTNGYSGTTAPLSLP